MTLEGNGKILDTEDNGNLTVPHAWEEDDANALPEVDGIELGQEHLDVLNYLRHESVENNEQPMVCAFN